MDDEPDLRELYRRTLTSSGYRVLVAANGVEAVATYAREGSQIAAVVMDLDMPEMGGATAIQVLKRLNLGVQILVASGSRILERRDAASFLLACPVLEKPFSADSILAGLARLFSLRTA